MNITKSDKRLRMVKKCVFFPVLVMLIGSVIMFFIVDDSKKERRLFFSAFQMILMLLVIVLPDRLKKRLDLKIPIAMEISFVLFAFCGCILGDVFDFYGKFPIWDSILHALSGVLLAYVGLVIIRHLVQREIFGVALSPIFISITVVLFSLSLGAVWEIIEFTSDEFFDTNAQQYMKTTTGTLISSDDKPLVGHEALGDTMKDLILDFVGATGIAVFEYIDIKKKIKNKEVVWK